MVYNTVLTAEKRGPQIVGAQIAGVYCIWIVTYKQTENVQAKNDTVLIILF